MSPITRHPAARYDVGGIAVSALTLDAAVERLIEAMTTREHLSAHFATAHTVVAAHHDPRLASALEVAELVLPDGAPLAWIGRARGLPVRRVCGPDLMPALLDRGRAAGARHYFYGGVEGVPERLASAFRRRFPGLVVAGCESPPFRPLTPAEDAAAVARINAARPDFVWVGLGTPKQDQWIADHRGRLDATALLGVGAAFDMHSGRLRRAPRWMQRSGFEWLFRLLQEPRRLAGRYTIEHAQFLELCAAGAIPKPGRAVLEVRTLAAGAARAAARLRRTATSGTVAAGRRSRL